ncbi:hypothetical protein H744_1c0477 [Photobacterium gaetbulicola Gung47]|uniref:ABC transporter permease n=1 Tax=Photobacterium gaetbulicola Gung47 TaxID=658445 RepID=A0A0C5WH38_9GAMM|nr:hypothetical protein H744_1c0477 [Photobacterium gaetbulicola Gung47]
MLRYLYFTRNTILTAMSYRVDLLFNSIGNAVYLVLLYFLWNAIFDSREVIAGKTFDDVYIKMAFASSLIVMYRTHVEWYISDDILTGDITLHLSKPFSYQLMYFFRSIGEFVWNMVLVFLPVVLYFVLFYDSSFGWVDRILLFIVAVFFGYYIGFCIDYLVGLTAFFTESVWGASSCKDVLMMFCSGAIVPIYLFPETIKSLLISSPFYFVVHFPLDVLFDPTLDMSLVMERLVIQIFWCISLMLFGKFLTSCLVKKVTINGG